MENDIKFQVDELNKRRNNCYKSFGKDIERLTKYYDKALPSDPETHIPLICSDNTLPSDPVSNKPLIDLTNDFFVIKKKIRSQNMIHYESEKTKRNQNKRNFESKRQKKTNNNQKKRSKRNGRD